MLPNTFTPNGDGINDIFRPFIYRYIATIECFIYDRWGNLIHTSRDLNNLWDGTYRGQPAPEGTYFYLIQATLDTRDQRPFQKSGSLTLLR
jgi:gliding motility-associated-like protein